MTDKRKKQTMDDRPAYETPRALRLGDQHAATGGVICSNGSGDAFECTTGSTANTCVGNGNAAANVCNPSGNSPGGGD